MCIHHKEFDTGHSAGCYCHKMCLSEHEGNCGESIPIRCNGYNIRQHMVKHQTFMSGVIF